MTRKTPRNVEEKVLQLWLQGQNYREVATECGVVLATVSRIIGDARKQTPNLDDLRDLSLTLKKSDVSLVDVLGSLPLMVKFREMNVSVKDLSLYVEHAEKVAGNIGVEPGDFINAAVEILRFQKEGKAPEEILKEAKCKEEQMLRLDEEIEKRKAELRALRDKLKLGRDLSYLKDEIAKAKNELELYKSRLIILKQQIPNKAQAFQCPCCGNITTRYISASESATLLQSGQPLTVSCVACGYPMSYNVMWVLANIGLQILQQS